MAAPDCFGLQPDLVLRIAVVDVGDKALLIWLRNDRNSTADAMKKSLKSFERMLASIRFSERTAQTSSAPTGQAATPIDGVWTASWTHDELVKSPLLIGKEEINDENWGQHTLTFKNGLAIEAVKNPHKTLSGSFQYSPDGDTVTFQRANGEQFIMRWTLKGNHLTFTRDASLGVGPTPYVIKPWTRQH
jgi:hypothetical protein